MPSQINQTSRQIQTDAIGLNFSKIFKEYIKIIQHQNSQRANSILTSDVFSAIYNYISILESKEAVNESPPQTSRHATVRQEIILFSQFLDTLCETVTNNEISKNKNMLNN